MSVDFNQKAPSLHSISPEPQDVEIEATAAKVTKNRGCLGACNKENWRRPVCYQVIYSLCYFIMGSVFSAAALSLSYLEFLLDINTAESSLIYSVFYIANILGSIIAGKAVNQTKFANVHLFLAANCIIGGCFCLSIIQFITSYIIMIINWFIIGIFIGALNVTPTVFICRVYGAQGAIIFSRMLLCQSFGSVVFSVIYTVNNAIYLFYGIVINLLIISFFVTFILPTPQESELIDKITQQVMDNPIVEIKEKMTMS